ncbi:MAG TPA: peroxiredoxin-like family protein [Acidimicrobiales bacterium]|nr:peroxiredoxin-like family protein [Acidimicrobiales bacterium]
MFCREAAAQLRRHQSEIEEEGAGIVAIGTGNRQFAAAFVRDEAIRFPVLIDDRAEAAKAIELGRTSALGLLRPSVIAGRRRAAAAGHSQKRLGERPMQLGATLVIGRGGEVLYSHMDSDVADHAPIEDVLAALRQ